MTDLLPQYNSITNLSPQPPSNSIISSAHGLIDSHLDRYLHSIPPNQVSTALIDHFIDSPVLSHQLNDLAASLINSQELQFYTDGSLQRALNFIDSIGLG